MLILLPLVLTCLFMVGSGLATVSDERSGSYVVSLVATSALAAETCDLCDYSGGYPSCCLECGTGPGEDMGTGCYTPDPNQVCQFDGICEETVAMLASGEVVLIATGACSDAGSVPVQDDSAPTPRAGVQALFSSASALARNGAASFGFLVLAGTTAMRWTALAPRFAVRRSGLRR